jgi:hypothetical protein
MREDHRKNQNNRNNRNRKHGQKNQNASNKEQKDKKVPMRYQIRNSKETNTVELKYTDMDGAVDKPN